MANNRRLIKFNAVMRKCGLYFLSLWLLFVFIFIMTIDIPMYWGGNWVFVGWRTLLQQNVVSCCCVVALLLEIWAWYDFSFVKQGTQSIPYKIASIENIEHEQLSFLSTCIMPLICFDFENIRHLIILLILLIIMGGIYIKTKMFYANPTLAILGFQIYKATLFRENDNEAKENVVLISKEKLSPNTNITYIKLDNNVFYAYKQLEDDKRGTE